MPAAKKGKMIPHVGTSAIHMDKFEEKIPTALGGARGGGGSLKAPVSSDITHATPCGEHIHIQIPIPIRIRIHIHLHIHIHIPIPIPIRIRIHIHIDI